MKHLAFLFSFLPLFAPIAIGAQAGTFRYTYSASSGDGANVFVLPDSSYVLIGFTQLQFQTHGMIMKLDTVGQLQWKKSYSNPNTFSSPYSLGIPLSGGGYMLGQYLSVDSLTLDNRYIQLDANGNVIRSSLQKFSPFSSELLQEMMQTSDGSVVGIGQVYINPALPSPAIKVVKIDTSGNLAWELAIETDTVTGKEYATDVIETNDSNYLVCGRSFNPVNNSFDNYLVKISPAGVVLWQQFYGSAQPETTLSVAELSDGSLMCSSLGTDPNGNSTAQLFKTTANGNLLWVKNYAANPPNLFAAQLVVKPNDQVMLYGHGGLSATSPALIALDTAGNVLWCRYYYVTGNATVTNMALTPDNGFVLAGKTNDPVTSAMHIYVIKTDSVGKSGCLGSPVTCTVTAAAYTSLSFGYNIPGGSWKIDSAAAAPLSAVQTTICSEVGVQEIEPENAIQLYPNPAKEVVNIVFRERTEGELKLTDASGRIVKQILLAENTEEVQLDLSGIAPGFYFVSTILSNGSIHTLKLLVE